MRKKPGQWIFIQWFEIDSEPMKNGLFLDLDPSSLRPWGIVNRVVLSTWGDSFAYCPQMHEIFIYYRTYWHAVSGINLSVLNVRFLYTVKIPLPHTAHDKSLIFSKTDRNYIFH